jgi:tetratricopeptide (TPR) repeat protein
MPWLPDLWRVPSHLAVWFNRRGAREVGKRITHAYVRIRPGDPHAWVLWAQHLDHSEQVSVLRKALNRHPFSPLIAYRLAFLSYGDQDDPRDDLRRLLRRAKDHHPEDPLSDLGLALLAKDEGKVDEALGHCLEALERLESFPGTKEQYYLALALLDLNETELARQVLRHGAESSDPYHSLLLGVLEEEPNKRAGNKYLRRARRYWFLWGGSMQSFQEELERLRGVHSRAKEKKIAKSPDVPVSEREM